jgi:epoxide hydrolase-like predicted phosphatase
VTRPFDAVLFDFGGVLVGSPFEAMLATAAPDVEPDVVLALLLGDYGEDGDHPWHRAERGEISILDWVTHVQQAAKDAEIALDLMAMRGMMTELAIHDEMVDAVRRLRADGYRTAIVTNNVREASASWRERLPLDDLFDIVVDSSDVGMRKPNPAIYAHALELLGVEDPARAIFLDDHPANVAGAEAAGMSAILVSDPADAVAALDRALDGNTDRK